jgi:branched-chain amino acid aminotransferase
MDIKITKASQLKDRPQDDSALGFGKIFTDHMLIMKYNKKSGGWGQIEIKPYGDLSLDPAACGLHYGQLIFEGLKCFRIEDDSIQLFRARRNFERMNRSATRMCMPPVNIDDVMKGLKELLKLDKAWVPKTKGTSLYVRPTMVATEPFLGVHPADELIFYIILCPVGAYYASGFAPVKIMVEDKYVRSTVGGVGDAKTAGNYAASLKSAEEAAEKGFTQVLWLDAQERKYVEEVGTMNMMFKINGEVITPPLTGSILPGVTRDSIINILKDLDIKVTERRITIDEVVSAAKDGTLEESFGTGTAAVITPVGSITYKGETYKVNDFKLGPLAEKLFNTLTAIQYGESDDKFGWIEKVE